MGRNCISTTCWTLPFFFFFFGRFQNLGNRLLISGLPCSRGHPYGQASWCPRFLVVLCLHAGVGAQPFLLGLGFWASRGSLPWKSCPAMAWRGHADSSSTTPESEGVPGALGPSLARQDDSRPQKAFPSLNCSGHTALPQPSGCFCFEFCSSFCSGHWVKEAQAVCPPAWNGWR